MWSLYVLEVLVRLSFFKYFEWVKLLVIIYNFWGFFRDKNRGDMLEVGDWGFII